MFCVGNQWELCTQWELVMFVSQDCNWGDHCARVSAKYGVVSQKTPSGLQWKEFVQAMAKFDRKARKNDDWMGELNGYLRDRAKTETCERNAITKTRVSSDTKACCLSYAMKCSSGRIRDQLENFGTRLFLMRNLWQRNVQQSSDSVGLFLSIQTHFGFYLDGGEIVNDTWQAKEAAWVIHCNPRFLVFLQYPPLLWDVWHCSVYLSVSICLYFEKLRCIFDEKWDAQSPVAFCVSFGR